ncbi:DUF1203 domain-containing protein [Aestuariivivens sediminis]|uniref:DUF1203 domain-containing protein n=1 Tax=Aestuariivivens sediminis TaxID=2913557 RepID=UPI001F55C491|nr:DUF1203 domain-containing protein [Aestuariivivens sediminis]
MKYDFIITGIKSHEIEDLLNLNDQELKARGFCKLIADENPGYPCRISLEDAHVGEELLAFHYEHHKVNSPYRSSGPVFVRYHAGEAHLKKNEIPNMLRHRHLSLRTYNDDGMMIDARTLDGKDLESHIQNLFSNKKAKYIQVHNAKPGCYNCQIDRLEKEIQ